MKKAKNGSEIGLEAIQSPIQAVKSVQKRLKRESYSNRTTLHLLAMTHDDYSSFYHDEGPLMQTLRKIKEKLSISSDDKNKLARSAIKRATQSVSLFMSSILGYSVATHAALGPESSAILGVMGGSIYAHLLHRFGDKEITENIMEVDNFGNEVKNKNHFILTKAYGRSLNNNRELADVLLDRAINEDFEPSMADIINLIGRAVNRGDNMIAKKGQDVLKHMYDDERVSEWVKGRTADFENLTKQDTANVTIGATYAGYEDAVIETIYNNKRSFDDAAERKTVEQLLAMDVKPGRLIKEAGKGKYPDQNIEFTLQCIVNYNFTNSLDYDHLYQIAHNTPIEDPTILEPLKQKVDDATRASVQI